MTFKAADLIVEKTENPKAKPDPSELGFGRVFSDHMLLIEVHDTNVIFYRTEHIAIRG